MVKEETTTTSTSKKISSKSKRIQKETGTEPTGLANCQKEDKKVGYNEYYTGALSPEERKNKVQRYLEKKARKY